MVDRRTMFTVTAGAALGAVMPATVAAAGTGAPASGRTAAAPERRPVPRTLSVVRNSKRGRLRVPETAFPLTHLGVTWRGRAARARVRTAVGWTGWQVMQSCGGGPDGAGHVGGSALLTVSGAVGYELALAGSGTVEATELNTVDGPAMTSAAAVADGMPLPDGTICPVPYLSRAAWGADESLRDWPPTSYPVQTLTVHHTAGANDDPNPAATVRAIYFYQAKTQEWGDIGYHLLVDEAGQVYEGRWSGPDSVPVFDSTVGPDGRPQGVTAAHVLGYNSGNLSVCLLGDFTNRLPTTAAWDSMTRVLAGLARNCRLDPVGTTNYVNPESAATKTVKTICGHRDWAATQCPGNLFYPHLPTVREQVASLMPPATVPRKPATSVVPRQPVPRR